MSIKEIKAKSILRKHKKIDSWFLSCYGMNLYRGCMHNCVYCDGRAEKYNVNGDFGKDVAVKINAIDLLKKELNPNQRLAPLKKGFIMLGGGVGDSYQPVEKEYKLTRKALELMKQYKFPVHILTKSTLVERDIDLIKDINKQSRAIVSFSFSSVNDKISQIFEPGVPEPSKRLETLELFKKEGISCGMFLMPVIPFITDKPEFLEESIKKAKELGLDFIIFSGMTLKDGRQKEYFINALKDYNQNLITEYTHIYRGDKWGNTVPEYYTSLQQAFNIISKKYRIPRRIPPNLYRDLLEENDIVMVILEQIDYLLKLDGKKSPYGYAAYSISQIKQPLSTMKNSLRSLNGVGTVTENLILEIIETKNSTYLNKLLV